jgi:hypothetical protein
VHKVRRPIRLTAEALLLRLASLTATALDALAQLHLPEYRAKVVSLRQ